MRKLVSVNQILDEAEDRGIDPERLLVDPEDVCELSADILENLEQNPDDPDE